jgi:hypothetical protein
MLGSFFLGPVGGLIRLVGFLIMILGGFSAIAMGVNSPGYPLLGLGFMLFVVGSYFKYVSRQTVRVRGGIR